MIWKRSLYAPLVLAVLSLVGCGRGEPPAPPAEGERASASPALTPEARAEAARDALGQRLMARVMTSVAESGHASAVTLCRDEAGPMTELVAREHGVRIGRTSERLRNPENRPPAWAVAHLRERPESALTEQGPGGEHRAIFPIRLAEPCLACHGSAERLAPGVSEALAALYPDDRAKGYESGELRGWFWVEVPASP